MTRVVYQVLKYLLPVLVFSPLFAANGQSSNFINYGIGDGLAHESVLDICQDKYGNLWFATLGGGISRFNGLAFKNITIRDGLASNYVRDVMADRNGNIWAATANGISMYNGKSIRTWAIDGDGDNGSVNAIFEDHEGNIWFSAPGGNLGKIVPMTGQVEVLQISDTQNDKILAIGEDKKNQIWFISVVKGLFNYDGKEFSNVISHAEFKGYLLSLYIDEEGILWLGSTKGLLRFDPDHPDSKYEFFKPLEGIFVKNAQVGDTSSFWSISPFGLVQYENKQVCRFGALQGFTDTGVNSLFCDREGTLWVATDGDGIYKLSNQAFSHFGDQHGLNPNDVTSVTEDRDGNYWITSHGGGVDVYDGNTFKNYNSAKGISNSYLSASTMDKDGNVWFGTRGSGVIRYSGDGYTYFDTSDGLVYNVIRCLFTDSRNNVWVGTSNGLSRYDGRAFHNYTVTSGLYDNIIWNISEPEPGKVMIVTRKGISHYLNGEMTRGFNDSSVFDKRVNIALKDSLGNYWIGYSGHGVLRVDHKTGDKQYFTSEEGLSSDLIYNMIFDDNGNLVIGSERGMDILFLSDSRHVERIKNYGKTEGFYDLQTTHNTAFKDSKGYIWFGGSRGLFRYNPAKSVRNMTEPLVYISGMKLSYQDVDWKQYADSTTNWFNLPVGLRLPYNRNNIVIEYFGNSLTNPAEVKYRFRLAGLQDEWSPVTGKSEAVYTNLSPGQYRFEVVAANSDDVWSQQPASISFEIVPPFWQESWFFVVLVLLMLLGIKLFNDYRVRAKLNRVLTVERIRAEELVKVRKRMARDFHDNMGNQLASITVFANLISLRLKDKSEEIDELLQNIEKHTKSLFNGTKDFIWSIDPESDHLDEVFTYIKDFGEDLFAKTNISFFSKADDLGDQKLSLPSGWSRQIVLIFKEAMTNALKHSQADEVHLNLNLDKNEFVITFMDNGVGLDLRSNGRGNGLKNIHSRAGQINCKVDVESIGEEGTTILFRGSIQSEQKEKGFKIY